MLNLKLKVVLFIYLSVSSFFSFFVYVIRYGLMDNGNDRNFGASIKGNVMSVSCVFVVVVI